MIRCLHGKKITKVNKQKINFNNYQKDSNLQKNLPVDIDLRVNIEDTSAAIAYLNPNCPYLSREKLVFFFFFVNFVLC